jgi:predicted Zn-dependent protease
VPRSCASRRAFLCCAAPLLLWLAACGPISVSQEQRLGYEFEYEMRRELVFVHDRVVGKYVSGMGNQLVHAAGSQPFDYHFYVVDDDEINAFAGPAGHIYIHSETILKARNASELAGVIAHEVGHVALRHIANNYNRQRNTKIGQGILVAGASIFGGGGAGSAARLGTGLAAMAYLNSFGREAETEADAFAVEVLTRAGYDPNGLVTFFRTLAYEAQGKPEAPGFLSSHPATSDRIESTIAAIEALPSTVGLRVNDGGKLEIIQRRIQLLTHRDSP